METIKKGESQMKTIKKINIIFTILLCLVMSMLLLTACGGEETSDNKTPDNKVTDNKTPDNKAPDFKAIYNAMESNYGWTVGDDGSYLSADTNIYNLDSYSNSSILDSIHEMNKKLGLPDSLWNDMLQTTWSMGKQEETYERIGIKVTWTYHPDKGLEVTYKLLG